MRRRLVMLAGALLWGAGMVPSAPGAPVVRKTTGLAVWPVPELARVRLDFAATSMKDARRVYPHPVLPGCVIVQSDTGLRASDDAGRTWRELPAATRERVGRIHALVYPPTPVDGIWLATERGLYYSADAGRTFTLRADRSKGLAGAAVRGLAIYGGDPSLSTLVAWHGAEALGASVSYDGGASWRVLWPDLFVHQVATDTTLGAELKVIGATRDRPDVLYVSSATKLGEALQEDLRDVLVTDLTAQVQPLRKNGGSMLYLAVADGQGYCLPNGWGAKPRRIGPVDSDGLASLTVARYPKAEGELVLAYEPRKRGLLLSLDGLATWTAGQATGLPTGPFIREGAQVRAAADGMTFYATVNGTLYRAEMIVTGALRVREAMVTPAVLAYAPDASQRARAELRQEIALLPQEPSAATAARRVEHRMSGDDADSARRVLTATVRVTGAAAGAQVYINLAQAGGAEQQRMFDDGIHNDGAAGDGLYGTTFQLGGNRERARYPGVLALPIAAVNPDGAAGNTTAVLGVYELAEDFSVWDEPMMPGPMRAMGATAEVREDPAQAQHGKRYLEIRLDPPGAMDGSTIDAGQPWQIILRKQGHSESIAGFDVLEFWVRAEGGAGDELSVALRDEPELTLPTTTTAVAVGRTGLVRGGAVTGEWRKVEIPLQRFLQTESTFQPSLFTGVVLSGAAQQPGKLWVDDVRWVRHRSNAPTATSKD